MELGVLATESPGAEAVFPQSVRQFSLSTSLNHESWIIFENIPRQY